MYAILSFPIAVSFLNQSKKYRSTNLRPCLSSIYLWGLYSRSPVILNDLVFDFVIS